MDKMSFTFGAGVFVTLLIALGTLGMPFVSSPASVDEVNSETDICSNIGGFNAVGDVLGCVSDRLGILDYLSVSSENQFISFVLVPITLTTGLMVILIIRGS
jgi:hypothetical protein